MLPVLALYPLSLAFVVFLDFVVRLQVNTRRDDARSAPMSFAREIFVFVNLCNTTPLSPVPGHAPLAPTPSLSTYELVAS